MPLKLKFFTFLFLLNYSIFAHAVTLYSIDDLRQLHTEKNYNEYLKHALDIRPSKRDKNWSKLTFEMGEILLKSLNSKPLIEKASFEQVLSISKWPVFAKNEFFTEQRDQVFLKYIRNCFDSGQKNCFTLAKDVYSSFSHLPQFDFHFIESLAPHGPNTQNLTPFIRNIVNHELGEFFCAKEPLKSIVIDDLYSLIDSANLNKSIHTDCFRVLRADLKHEISSLVKHRRDGALKILKSFKALSNIDISLYYVTNALQGAKYDDRLKSELDKMSKDFQLREDIMKVLNSLERFPDKLFSKPQDKINIVKTKMLFKNFPEVIDNYALTCLKHLESKTTTKGNPTPYCDGLFKINNSINILSRSMIKRFEKAKSFQ